MLHESQNICTSRRALFPLPSRSLHCCTMHVFQLPCHHGYAFPSGGVLPAVIWLSPHLSIVCRHTTWSGLVITLQKFPSGQEMSGYHPRKIEIGAITYKRNVRRVFRTATRATTLNAPRRRLTSTCYGRSYSVYCGRLLTEHNKTH